MVANMAELIFRGYRAEDATGLAELLNLLDQHAGGEPGHIPAELHNYVVNTIGDPAANSRLAVAPEGRLAAAALVAPPPPAGNRVFLLGGVHPAFRGRGLGRQLFGWQLDRAATLHRESARRPPNAPSPRPSGPPDWAAGATVLDGDEDAIQLFRRHGLTPSRYWYDMVAPTGKPDLAGAALPDGLSTATYRPEYERDLHAAREDSFADHWGFQSREFDAWVARTTRAPTFRADLSRLALVGAQVAGFVLSYQDSAEDRIYIGQVGVRRPWRRRGVATILLTEVLAAAERAGFRGAVLGVDADSPTGAVGVYERLGFVTAHRAVSYTITLRG
jgi:mycothiol synthase